MFRPEGAYAALVTPFRADGGLDLAGLAVLAEHAIGGGIAGLCPLGGTGEPLSQSLDEHRAVIDATLAAADGRVPVLVGCLKPDPAEVVALARHAKAAGAAAAMLIPPYFVQAKPAHIHRHFHYLAERIELPLVLFNSPGRSGLKLDAEAILRLVAEIPHLVGIKEASGDLALCGELARSARPGFALLQGFDEAILPTLAVGGVGSVVSLGCLVPELVAGIHQAWRAGDLVRARALQAAVLPLARAIYAEPNPAPLKRALALLGLPAGPTRPPLFPIAGESETALRQALGQLPAAAIRSNPIRQAQRA